jgi:hypothetical protein
MKIATLPKSGTHLFQNIVNYLREDRGLTIELDHILMPNRPDFIDDVTPTIVTSRDPRGYFYSLMNWYNKRSADPDWFALKDNPSYREKVTKWRGMTDEEKLSAVIDDTPDSLMVVSSHDSYNAILKAASQPNCYVTTFEKFAPSKDPSAFGEATLREYVQMFDHLGIKMDSAYASRVIEACWGHSVTFTPNGTDDWRHNLPRTLQSRIIDRYGYVYEALGYEI